MSRIIINNETDLHDLVIIQVVQRLIGYGKVSGKGEFKQYAYGLRFEIDGVYYMLWCRLNRRSKTQTMRISKDYQQ
jgi:hypothetical protein